MPKFYQHQQDLTYYTKIYKGGIATYQIAPRGVDYLKRRGYQLDQEIWSYDIHHLEVMGWLYTKGEVDGFGVVSGVPDSLAYPTLQLTSWFETRYDSFDSTSTAFRLWLERIRDVLDSDAELRDSPRYTATLGVVKEALRHLGAGVSCSRKLLVDIDALILKLYTVAKEMPPASLIELRRTVHTVPELPTSSLDLDQTRSLAERLRAFVSHAGTLIRKSGTAPEHLERRVLTAVIFDVFAPTEPNWLPGRMPAMQELQPRHESAPSTMPPAQSGATAPVVSTPPTTTAPVVPATPAQRPRPATVKQPSTDEPRVVTPQAPPDSRPPAVLARNTAPNPTPAPATAEPSVSPSESPRNWPWIVAGAVLVTLCVLASALL